MMLRKVVESPSLKIFNKFVVVAPREMDRCEHGSAVLIVTLMILESFAVLTAKLNSMLLILHPSQKISPTHIPRICCPGKLHTKCEDCQPRTVLPCWLCCQCVSCPKQHQNHELVFLLSSGGWKGPLNVQPLIQPFSMSS